MRRLVTTCLLYGVAFHVWSSFILLRFDGASEDLDPLEEMGVETGEDMSDDEVNEVNEEDPIFIPIGWPRMRQGELYAPSDAEWQEFVKVARDKQRLHALRDELATIVWRRASQSSQIGRVLGSPLTLTGSWLVHRFPYRAPPEYELSGLEISDSGISWVSKPIAPEQGDQLRKFIRPLAVTLAIRDAYLVLWRRQLERIRNFLSPHESQPTRKSNIPIAPQTYPPDSSIPDGKNQVSQVERQLSTPGTLKGDISRGDDSIRLHPSLIISTLQRLPMPKFGPGSDLYQASIAFKSRLKESWARDPPTPRRGVFYVSGPVGLKGPRGYCRIEVRGEYDPTAGNWTAISMHLKDLNLYNQRALGGRV